MNDRRRIAFSRREFVRAALGVASGIAFAPLSAAEPDAAAGAGGARMQAAIRRRVGAAHVKQGKVRLELPPLVENGNAVPLSVRIDSPMTPADHVKAVHVFSEKNPRPEVASFYLGPRAGRASVATRIRLADTQDVVAICEMSDGSFWFDRENVVVTLAACLEEI